MRRRILMNKGWKFTIAGRETVAVDVPHTWNALDGQDGGNDYFRGKGVYEKTFDISSPKSTGPRPISPSAT